MSSGLVPLKNPVKKRPMRVTYIEAQSPPVVVMWKKEESGASTGVILVTLSSYIRLLVTDPVIWNHSQVTRITPELAPPLLSTIPHQREDVGALKRFNVHRFPSRQVLSVTGLEFVTSQARSDILSTRLPWPLT
ncbi:uncharacterized protein TNCV_4948881 [Trichonephila clavipes]|nr:uncharacterized protein TNCV_4948881 [Trichonephila clavipes]